MPDDTKPTRPSSTTREAEAADAQVHATPDEMPTPDEEAAAERAGPESPEVAENYEEAIERGARQKGRVRSARLRLPHAVIDDVVVTWGTGSTTARFPHREVPE